MIDVTSDIKQSFERHPPGIPVSIWLRKEQLDFMTAHNMVRSQLIRELLDEYMRGYGKK